MLRLLFVACALLLPIMAGAADGDLCPDANFGIDGKFALYRNDCRLLCDTHLDSGSTTCGPITLQVFDTTVFDFTDADSCSASPTVTIECRTAGRTAWDLIGTIPSPTSSLNPIVAEWLPGQQCRATISDLSDCAAPDGLTVLVRGKTPAVLP